ncbi:MAG: agmatine deiminase, partial [Elusimicrobiota bacterium]|nr:agmatine deiminase [Elusimicrobiota bacterium]
EFSPHKCTYMIFPYRTDNWPNKALAAQEVFCDIAKRIAHFEPVKILVPKPFMALAQTLLKAAPENLQIFECDSDDAWARDTGATFIINNKGDMRAIDWKFNAWGGNVDGLYDSWDKDDLIAEKMCEIEKVDYYRADDFVLEGGSIHVDGQGTLLTTAPCLLSKGRNPHLTKAEIENKLKQYLNVKKIIWLPAGIYEDETNEHVDNICCFVKPGEVLLAWTDDKNDPQYEMSKKCYEFLSNETDALGRKFIIHKIILPSVQNRTFAESVSVEKSAKSKARMAGERLSASYVNFYILNGAIIAPIFKDPNDDRACAALEELFYPRRIVPVYSRDILVGGGNIHCITQQVPDPLKWEK